MKDYKISFGAELEFSDVDRSIGIPKELGSWEGPKIAGMNLGSELDIVNTKGEWRGIATDPLCVSCPVGGEIHVNPSWTIDSQLIRILRIIDLFPQIGVACVNHGHIHVGIPGIRKDLQAIKNLFTYTRRNELYVLKACSGYYEVEASIIENANLNDWVKDYLLVGDAKAIGQELYDRVEKAETLSEVWKALKEVEAYNFFWTNGRSRLAPGSHRTAVNLYNLLKMESVEFRVFRASLNPVEIYSSLLFSQRYIEEALKGKEGKPVTEILKEGQFRFAPLNFDEKLAQGWEATRWDKGRSRFLKKTTGISEPSEDPFSSKDPLSIEHKDLSSFDIRIYVDAVKTILELCKLDFKGEKVWPK